MTRLLKCTALLALLGSLAGCSLLRSSVAALKSTADFVPQTADQRVLAEPGAEDVAVVAARELATAIATVEQEQYGPFLKPVAVYVTRDGESFATFTGVTKEVKGAVIVKLFLSGELRKEPDRIKRILTHELSHLHLGQRLGVYDYNAHLPSWFQEGLAVVVSNGGGAEKTSIADASTALRTGKSLTPETDGSFLFKKFASSYGLTPPMFYRQSGMFVAWLRQQDATRFRTFLLAIESEEDFATAFTTAYGMEVDAAWRQFVNALPATEPSTSHPS